MVKKIFFISLFFFTLFLIILVAYKYAFKKDVSNPTSTDASPTQELDQVLEETAPAVSTKLENPINEEVIGAVTGPGGALFYYSFSDEALKKASFEGKDKEVLLSNLPGIVERVLWSPQRDALLLGLRQGGVLRFHHVDLTTKTLTPLKPAVSRAIWSQNGEKIYYQYTASNGERSLDTANPNGSSFSTLVSMGTIDHFLSAVPQSGRVAFWTRPTGLETTILESVEKNGEDKKTLLTNRYGADYLWSPNGKYILFSALRERAGSDISLALMNENGGEIRDLSIPTLVSKAVWSQDSKTLYYALPGNLPSENVLPNDYYQKPLYSEDTFWKIDIETGQKSRLLELTEGSPLLDSSELFLSNKEDYLFFTDRKSKKLYRIEL